MATVGPMIGVAWLGTWFRDHLGVVAVLSCLGGLGLIRLFSLFHELSHRSFFPSPRVNDVVGTLLGVILFTPFGRWRMEHGLHHAGVGNLDRRGRGDVPMLTVDEYRGAPRRQRWRYRVFRCPWVTFAFGGAVLFLGLMRRPASPGAPWKARVGVHATTVASGLYLIGVAAWWGLPLFCAVVLPAYFVTFVGVMWMYNIQHHFEGIQWSREPEWNYVTGCLRGSSYYRLPPVLEWITMQAGYHHLHHLFPDIPSYFLPRAQAELDRLDLARWSPPITWRESLQVVRWALYDEAGAQVVGFDALR